MYANEKYVRQEVRTINSKIKDLSADLGGDIKALHAMILDLQEQVKMLRDEINYERDRNEP